MGFEIENGVLKKYYEEKGVTKVVIPDNVTSIGKKAFSYCKNITKITISDSITSIGNEAFSHCTNLTEIIIPNSVTRIGYLAFNYCINLKEITIPDSVTRIRYDAFYKCENLTEIKVDDTNKIYCDIDGILFNKDKSILIKYPIGKSKNEYVISDSITSIGDGAFEGCHNLKEITIPDSVISIGDGAFEGCENLTEITIPDSVTSIGDDAFFWCRNLTEITIPHSVTGIGGCVFECCDNINKIIFYSVTFKPENLNYDDFYKAMQMLKTKDFSKKLNGRIKNPVIIGYYLKTEDETAEAYIKKNFAKIFRFIIDNEDIETVTKLLNTGKFVTKKNIDRFIDYAIENKKMEIQVTLMNYKNDNFGFYLKKTFRI